jgi:tRNA threonylcarbamoyladenosine biosynthesis protein TsaB
MILAVDTSTQQIGLALYDGVSVIVEDIWFSQNHHTKELSPAISRLFSKCAMNPRDLTGLAIAIGPGSFTGLRIGLSVVKGMALFLHIPVIGIPTLDILAAAQPLQEIPLVALLKAGRGRLAACWYDSDFRARKWISQEKYLVFQAEELSQLIDTPTLVYGELNGAERQVLEHKKPNIILGTPAQSIRRPSYLAEIAWQKMRNNQVDDVHSLTPIYLHMMGSKPA